MTLIELQRKLKQQRKYDRNPYNRNARQNYSDDQDGWIERRFDEICYKRALATANAVVQHYYATGVIPRKTPKVIFPEDDKE